MTVTEISALPAVPASVQEAAGKVKADPRIENLLKAIREDDEATLAEQITICEVEAPPFKETKRGELLLQLFRKYGLKDAYMDEEGNVLGLRKGTGNGPVVQIAAHQDTVFAEGTDVRVRKEGNVYHAPGISDDTRGLAAMLCVLRKMNELGIETVGDILFTASVGEEGNGDLRGEKFIHFTKKMPVDGFIGIDGCDVQRVLSGATGAHRWLMTFEGPGGHSFHKFHISPSAIHAMGRAIAKMADIEVPANPRTTYNAGVIKGGTTVNAIAERCEVQLDMRSSENEPLLKLEADIMRCFDEALEEENARCNATGDMALKLIKKQIGNRPAGPTNDFDAVVLASRASQNELGIKLTRYMSASTDHNIPCSLGIPATTLGAGGSEGNNHSLNEWWRHDDDAWLSPQLLSLVAITLAGLSGVTEPTLPKMKR